MQLDVDKSLALSSDRALDRFDGLASFTGAMSISPGDEIREGQVS